VNSPSDPAGRGQPPQGLLDDEDAEAETAAAVAAEKRACVRAYRATRSPSGSATGSRKASATPTGSAVPSASR